MITVPAGSRLRALREERGLSQEEMARILGLTHRQTVGSIEEGKRKLSADELIAAVQAFGVPIDHFTNPFIIAGEARFSWRREGDVAANDLAAFERKAGEWIGAFRELGRLIGSERSPLSFRLNLTEKSSFEAAESAAERFVSHFELGPVPSRRLAEVMEADLSMLVLMIDAQPGISGAACLVGDLAAVLVNRREPAGRRNFDLAHELFHILTWDAMPPQHVESAEISGERRRVEQMANAFAAALLMPRATLDAVEGDASDPAWINTTANRLGVSSIALKWRLKSTGRLTNTQVDALDDALLRHNGGRTEGDDETPLAFGPRFVSVMAEAIGRGRISVRRAAALLGVTVDELGDLCDAHGVARTFEI